VSAGILGLSLCRPEGRPRRQSSTPLPPHRGRHHDGGVAGAWRVEVGADGEAPRALRARATAKRCDQAGHIFGHTWVRGERGSTHNVLIDLAPRPGLEPGTLRINRTARCSAVSSIGSWRYSIPAGYIFHEIRRVSAQRAPSVRQIEPTPHTAKAADDEADERTAVPSTESGLGRWRSLVPILPPSPATNDCFRPLSGHWNAVLPN
jgi:hypothetical protein